jgi:nucleoid-associated protein YejK
VKNELYHRIVQDFPKDELIVGEVEQHVIVVEETDNGYHVWKQIDTLMESANRIWDEKTSEWKAINADTPLSALMRQRFQTRLDHLHFSRSREDALEWAVGHAGMNTKLNRESKPDV